MNKIQKCRAIRGSSAKASWGWGFFHVFQIRLAKKKTYHMRLFASIMNNIYRSISDKYPLPVKKKQPLQEGVFIRR